MERGGEDLHNHAESPLNLTFNGFRLLTFLMIIMVLHSIGKDQTIILMKMRIPHQKFYHHYQHYDIAQTVVLT